MGKDIRGIKRGKYNCGECDDFMRSDGVKCGYCGCFANSPFEKGSRSSDSVSEQQEGKSNAGTGANGNTSQLRPRSRGPGGACPPIFLKF